MNRRGFVAKVLAAGALQKASSQAVSEPRRIGPEVRVSGPGWYDEPIESSASIREEQHRQLLNAIQRRLAESDKSRSAFWSADLRDIRQFEQSQRKLREAYFRMIGYPPPIPAGRGEPRITKVGEAHEVTVYRIFVPALEGIETYGMLFVPRLTPLPAPLLICQHGGATSPEVFCSSFNARDYNDIGRRCVLKGYVVYAPLVTMVNRNKLHTLASYLGTSLTAIEVFKIQRGLDFVLKRPEVLPDRVGMIGLSWGGFFTLHTSAIETRIRAAAVSCSFRNLPMYLEQHPESFISAMNHFGQAVTVGDSETASLICPRPLAIEMGVSDPAFSIASARKEVARVSSLYKELGIGDRFEFIEHPGVHEFDGRGLFDFLSKMMA
jgi:hypothetical protein